MKNGPHQRPVLFASAHSPTNATGAVSASAFDGSEIEPVVEQVVFDRAPLNRADIAGDALRARNTALIDGRTAHAGLPRATSKQRAPSTRVSSHNGKMQMRTCLCSKLRARSTASWAVASPNPIRDRLFGSSPRVHWEQHK